MVIETEFFKTALNDFNNAKISYEGRNYNYAIFQLQQSVEKLSKAFGLIKEVIKENELKEKIGHLPHKIFSRVVNKTIESIQEVRKPNLMEEMIPPHYRNLDTKERLDGLNKIYKKIKFFNIKESDLVTKDKIEEFLDGAIILEQDEHSDQFLFETIKDDVLKTYIHFKTYFINVIKEDKNSPALKLIDCIINDPDEIVYQKLQEYKLKY